MAESHDPGVHSKARLFGHPIHPMIIPFPIAFLCGALLTDLIYWGTGRPFWAEMSFWLIVFGIATAILAALPGLIDYFSIHRARSHAAGWVHFLGNTTVVILSIINGAVRLPDAEQGVLWTGLLLSLVVTLLLVVTGWAGGELVYRHRIGVTGGGQPAGDTPGIEPAEEEPQKPAPRRAA